MVSVGEVANTAAATIHVAMEVASRAEDGGADATYHLFANGVVLAGDCSMSASRALAAHVTEECADSDVAPTRTHTPHPD